MVIDGKLREMPDIPPHMMNNFIARCKMLGSMPISTDQPRALEGTGAVKLGGENLELNIKSTPGLYGDKIVMRVPQSAARVAEKEKREIPEYLLKELNSILDQPGGILLVGRGIGTGQLDMVYSCLNYLRPKVDKIVTTEGTLKYNLPGIEKITLEALEGEELRKSTARFNGKEARRSFF